MATLYLDSSHHLVVALRTEGREIDYVETLGGKNSHHIHQSIHRLLEQNNLRALDIGEIIHCAGPGTYTGMRTTEGICQVFEWQKVKVSSFYHFEVPHLLGIREGLWFSRAYKGEVFLYRWGSRGSSCELVGEKDFLVTPPSVAYTYVPSPLLDGAIETNGIIKENIKKLMAIVSARGDRYRPYYYRSLDKEFKRSTLN